MPQGRVLDTITLKELYKDTTEGSFPILMDIVHEDIIWRDGSSDQENGHLRLINSNTAVMYNGKKYMPAFFEFTPPQENDKKVSDTTVTISAIDKRIVEIIRSIKTKPTAFIDAFFAKTEEVFVNENGKEEIETSYVFSKAYKYEFVMSSCTWDSTTAQWSLVYDPTMQMNVPMDKATRLRCPSLREE